MDYPDDSEENIIFDPLLAPRDLPRPPNSTSLQHPPPTSSTHRPLQRTPQNPFVNSPEAPNNQLGPNNPLTPNNPLGSNNLLTTNLRQQQHTSVSSEELLKDYGLDFSGLSFLPPNQNFGPQQTSHNNFGPRIVSPLPPPQPMAKVHSNQNLFDDLDPLRSNLDPMRSNLDPVQSNFDPMRSNIPVQKPTIPPRTRRNVSTVSAPSNVSTSQNNWTTFD